MARYALSGLSDQALLRLLTDLLARDRATTAELLACIAEVDERRLHLPAGYPSMYAWCVGALHLSEDAAYKRIQAARAARRFPAILEAVAEGRLHLSGVCLLAPHLTEETAEDLLAAATHRSKAGIEQLLAERFPRPDMLAWVAAIPEPGAREGELAPGQVDELPDPVAEPAPEGGQLAPGQVEPAGYPGQVDHRARVKPLSAQSFAVQFTLSRAGHEKLRRAQELLGHEIPCGDLGALFERALEALLPQLERRKFAATERPRPGRTRAHADSRHIPADVKRAVRERDQGRCTFVGENGHRCEARAGLQFDHVQAYARGGQATVSGIRLLCRAHNQYEAERTFGAEFMRHKRLAATEARAAAKARAAAEETAAADQTSSRVPVEQAQPAHSAQGLAGAGG